MLQTMATGLVLAGLLCSSVAGVRVPMQLAANGGLPTCPSLPQAKGMPVPPEGWSLKAILVSPQRQQYKCEREPTSELPPHYGFEDAPLYDIGSLLRTNKALFSKLSTLDGLKAVQTIFRKTEPFGLVQYLVAPGGDPFGRGEQFTYTAGGKRDLLLKSTTNNIVDPPARDEAFGLESDPPLPWATFTSGDTLVYRVNTVGGAGYKYCSPDELNRDGSILQDSLVQYWWYRRSPKSGITSDGKPAKFCRDGSEHASRPSTPVSRGHVRWFSA